MRALVLPLLLAACASPLAGPGSAQQGIGAADPVTALAIATLDAHQARSFTESREYCGYIGEDGTGTLRSTPATRGTLDGCDIPPVPADWRAIASWHTHGSWDWEYDSEVPSIDDMIGDLEEGVDGYISTPGGRVWKIDLATERAVILCGEGCVTADPRYRPDTEFPPASSYTLFELYQRFDDPVPPGRK